MHTTRSPPKYLKLTTTTATTPSTTTTTGGSTNNCEATSRVTTPSAAITLSPTLRTGSTGSTLTLNSTCSTNRLLESSTADLKKPMYYQHSHSHTHHHHSHYNSNGSSGGGSGGGSGGSRTTTAGKRGRKHNWGTRERTGMSFLIVIAFFAVFGLIILTELFMIDERSHSAMVMLRHGSNYGGRLGDSMPDYDNVKEDYDLLDESIMGDNKLGFVQFRDNKLKIQDADNANAGRLAGILLNSGAGNGLGTGGGGGMGVGGIKVPQIPWGKVLPTKIEETLPPYPIGMVPTSGSWQVVNGTRFKFFVFSAYYDRRDGAKLVRVIGATKTRGPERVMCRFWYLNRNASNVHGNAHDADSVGGNSRHRRYTSSTVMARVKIIRENWNLKYSACFILCPVRGPETDVPHYVSIVSRLRAPPGNLLTLRNTDWDPDFIAMQHGNHSTTRNDSSTAGASVAATTATSPPPTGDQIADKIAICVKPFHFNYDQALYLIEYLEFYALLGVSHFTFYNHTVGPHASCVLQHYMDGNIPAKLTAYDEDVAVGQSTNKIVANNPAKVNSFTNANTDSNQSSFRQARAQSAATPTKRHLGSHYVKPTISILPWDLRMRSQKEIRTEGLFAALNDCLYRNMYRYKYLALVDLDEFIVPRFNDTLNDLISSLNRRFLNRNIGAYSFQNAFFYLQFPDDALVYQNTADGLNTQMRASLVTQRKTKRRFKLHPQKQRSKYICKPEAVVEAGNHFIWEFAPGKGSLNVSPTEAILQHYRVCEFGGNDCIKAPAVTDRTATKYVNRLVQRVETVYEHLKARCELPELPPLPKSIPKLYDNEQNTVKQTSQTRQNDIKSNEQPKKPKLTMAINSTTSSGQTKGVEKITNTTLASKTNATTIRNQKADVPLANNAAVVVSSPAPLNSQSKRKLIVFEHDEYGVPQARVQYV